MPAGAADAAAAPAMVAAAIVAPAMVTAAVAPAVAPVAPVPAAVAVIASIPVMAAAIGVVMGNRAGMGALRRRRRRRHVHRADRDRGGHEQFHDTHVGTPSGFLPEAQRTRSRMCPGGESGGAPRPLASANRALVALGVVGRHGSESVTSVLSPAVQAGRPCPALRPGTATLRVGALGLGGLRLCRSFDSPLELPAPAGELGLARGDGVAFGLQAGIAPGAAQGGGAVAVVGHDRTNRSEGARPADRTRREGKKPRV